MAGNLPFVSAILVSILLVLLVSLPKLRVEAILREEKGGQEARCNPSTGVAEVGTFTKTTRVFGS